MSDCFYVDLDQAPDFQKTVAAFRTEDLRCDPEPDSGPWPEGTLDFHLDQISTRGVQVTRSGSEFEVRLLVASCPEDYDLAYRILEAVSGADQPIRLETGGTTVQSELRARFYPPGVWDEIAAPLSTLTLMIDREGGPWTLPGPDRIDYCVGPRTLRKLRESGDQSEYPLRLLEDKRRVIYGDYAGYDIASRWLSEANDESCALVFWMQGRATFLPQSTHVVLQTGDRPEEGHVCILREHLAQAAAGFITLVDEQQALLTAADARQWEAILDRARSVEIELPEPAGGETPARKWWQFWR